VAVLGLLILGLRGALGDEAFDAWGWRIPFMLGGVVAVVGYVIRRRLDDAEEYTEAKAEEERALASEEAVTSARSIARALEARRSMLLVILLQPPMALGAYLLTGYMYTFLVDEGGLTATQALLTNGSAVAVLALLLPFMGRLSDRFGRRRMYAAGAAWLFVTAYPAFVLASSGTVAGALIGQLFLAVGVALYASALFVGLIELFPTAVRCRSHGISYNLSVALFGGTTPLVATALIGATGVTVAPAFYAMALIGTLGVLGIILVPETRDIDLRTSVYERAPRDGSASLQQAVVSRT
jgi:MHS family proline/betaine transporter-like MFS transporter